MRVYTFRRLALFSFVLTIALWPAFAQACLGVSRTINLHSFKTHLGVGPGGSIGLRDREVVLTFDDGPIPATTNRVLKALNKECTKATFFVVGRMASASPKTLQKIARAGHTIAHHTNSHANLKNRSLSSARQEITRGISATRRALGPYKSRSSKLFRYPYLARSAALDKILRRKGLLPFSAGIMSQDWKGGSANSVVMRVMSTLSRQRRGVILLHDIHSRTASALPILLKRLKRGGYKVVHIRSGGSRGVAVASRSNKKIRSSSRTKRNKIRSTSRKRNAAKPKAKKFKLFARSTKKKSGKKSSAYSPKLKKTRKKLSVTDRKRMASLARSKKKKRSKGKLQKRSKATKRIFFKPTLKRKKGESTASYHYRIKRHREKSKARKS